MYSQHPSFGHLHRPAIDYLFFMRLAGRYLERMAIETGNAHLLLRRTVRPFFTEIEINKENSHAARDGTRLYL